MAEQEGVIKYRLNHRHQNLPENCEITALNSWRTVLHRLGLIGQDDNRYGGLGFGNISQRYHPDDCAFIISASQSGHIEQLTSRQYCLVQQADIRHNQIDSIGLNRPSSEALTHACIYRHNTQAHAVIHSHCPEIWRHTHQLGLAFTAAEIAYGTTEMAQAVADLLALQPQQSAGIFTMLGHKDGIVAFGNNIEDAAWQLIKCFNSAIEIEQVQSNQ